MTSLAFMECCQRLSITPRTLHQWLAQAEMTPHPHPTDARITCLTSDQLHLLATLHGRVLQPVRNDIINSEGGRVEGDDTDLRGRLVLMEAQITTLQLLREREQRTEERLLVLEAERACADQADEWCSGTPPVMLPQPILPSFACHPTEKPRRLVPLIEYGARGRYVLISPEEGEVPIMPDTPEWFAWLASLSSFRFVGQTGRFSARRGYNRRPNRCWYAQRGIHQKNYSKYIGVSEYITIARLEQIAAQFQLYVK